MNLVARQIYGITTNVAPPVDLSTNTYIGGVFVSISTPALLASKLAIDVSRISNFTVVGSDIKCKITGSYTIPSSAFKFDVTPNCTYYYDNDGLVTSVSTTGFYNQTGFLKIIANNLLTVGDGCFQACNLSEVILPNLTGIENNNNFAYNNGLGVIYIPRVLTIGTSASVNNGVFTSIKSGVKIYAHSSLATSNAGGVEADLAAAISSLGADVRYVTNFTAPNIVNTLASGTIYKTAIQLNFTAPTGSTNAIEYYNCYADGVFKNKITASGQYIVGLAASTSYNITIKSVDIFMNESAVSNILSVTTSSAAPSDADVTAFVSASGITDDKQIDAVDYLTTALKANSLWTIQKAIYPIVGASASTHKWNLKDPRNLDAAFRLNIPVSGYTHASTGMKGTVTGCNTYIQPSTQLSLNNTHLSFYSRDNTAGGFVEMGVQATLYIASNYGNVNYMAVNNSDTNQGAGINMESFIQVSRISSTQMKQYRNGVLIKTANVNSTSLNTNNIFLIGYNLYPTARECAFASIGEGMTDGQATTYYNIVQQFQTILLRQV